METVVSQVKAIEIMKLINYENEHKRLGFESLLSKNIEGEITAAEIGVYDGTNASFMLFLCPKMKLYLVDSYENLTIYTGGPVQHESFRNEIKGLAQFNLGRFDGNKEFVYKNSLDAVKDFKDEFFDFVYIDGDHEYDAVLKDVNAWYPKVKHGGILAGHDYVDTRVSTAVHNFISVNKDKLLVKIDTTPTHSDWVIDKP